MKSIPSKFVSIMGKFQSVVEISSQVFKVEKYIMCVIGKTNNTELILFS